MKQVPIQSEHKRIFNEFKLLHVSCIYITQSLTTQSKNYGERGYKLYLTKFNRIIEIVVSDLQDGLQQDIGHLIRDTLSLNKKL